MSESLLGWDVMNVLSVRILLSLEVILNCVLEDLFKGYSQGFVRKLF